MSENFGEPAPHEPGSLERRETTNNRLDYAHLKSSRGETAPSSDQPSAELHAEARSLGVENPLQYSRRELGSRVWAQKREQSFEEAAEALGIVLPERLPTSQKKQLLSEAAVARLSEMGIQVGSRGLYKGREVEIKSDLDPSSNEVRIKYLDTKKEPYLQVWNLFLGWESPQKGEN